MQWEGWSNSIAAMFKAGGEIFPPIQTAGILLILQLVLSNAACLTVVTMGLFLFPLFLLKSGFSAKEATFVRVCENKGISEITASLIQY